MRRTFALATAIAATSALAGCSASNGSDCESPSGTALDVIAESVGGVNPDLQLNNAHSAASPEDDSTWFITASIEGDGMGDGVLGLWSTSADPSRSDFSAAVESANGEASFYSDFPPGPAADTDPLVNNEGARSAQSCTLGNKPA